jgi:hypothetical protein
MMEQMEAILFSVLLQALRVAAAAGVAARALVE